MENGNAGCVVIHGFGGSVAEVDPLAQSLDALGYTVITPTLKGHTGKRKDLRGVRYQDWIHSVEESYLLMSSQCKKVFVLGFSMGGLLGIHLANKFKVDALVTLNTPIYYWNIKQILKNLSEDLKTRDFKHAKRYLASGWALPTSALINFNALLLETKAMVQHINCPIFIVQGVDDDTVRKESADYLFNHAGSEEKRKEFYQPSGHKILSSPSANAVMKDVTAFLQMLVTG